jgi:4,5-dihydroxyphthalate decarboxylase
VLRHQYDVAIEKITWVESVDEHLLEYRPPKRFKIEKIPGNERAGPLLAGGKIDAATMAGGGVGTELSGIRPLFENVYPEIKGYVEANGFFPINTVITVSRAAVARNPEMPRLMMKAFLEAKALYDAEISTGEEEHMGLSLKRLEGETGLRLSPYGFKANRKCIQTMIAYSYEQGIIRRLYEPEELFLLLDS